MTYKAYVITCPNGTYNKNPCSENTVQLLCSIYIMDTWFYRVYLLQLLQKNMTMLEY